MNITFIRHTKTCLPEGTCYGSADVDLAETAADDLSEVKYNLGMAAFDAIYASPLKRCRILSEFLFAHLPSQHIIFDDRLKEMNFGDWSMKTWDEIGVTKAGKKWFAEYETMSVPGGESFADLYKRVTEFWTEIKKQDHNSVAIVAHAGVIKAFLCKLENKSFIEVLGSYKIGYGEIIRKEIF
jgi:alpha-ribazole phosphatase